MGKHRVYEIAKELCKTNQEVIDILAKNNIQVKSTLSTVDDTVRDLVVKNSARKPVQEKKAAPAPQHIVKKEPVKQAEAAPKQVQTQPNSAANTQRPQQQQGQRPNNQGQRPNNQGPRPAAVNHQQGQNAGQNRPNQGISQQNRPNNQQGQRPQQQQGQRPNTQNQGQRFNQNRPNQGVNTQNRPNNQQGQRPQQGNRPQQRPQGGIYIGPRGQQPGQHNANAARPQQQGNARPQQGNMNNNNNARPQQGGTGAQRPQANTARPAGANNKPFNKNARKDKPQIKGSYATKDSRPNRSNNHMGRSNKRQGGNNNVPRVQQPVVEVQKPTYVEIGETINVKDFANLLKREVSEVIKSLFMLGVIVTINQDIDFDTALLVGSEFDVEVAALPPEEDPTEIPEVEDDPSKRLPRPPVITVMGHVDHGKTSLLVAIRKANVTAREAGGITQHIGAYQIEVAGGKKIAFIDTPGHEAFSEMRARGAKVTDIVVLVVAANDGIMPQTVEAIRHAQAAEVPIVVAINKIDLPGADPMKVKTALLQHGIAVEDMGGEYLSAEVSAKKRINIDKLVEAILLQAEILDLKANPNRMASGTVVEAKMEKGRGSVATVLVQNGTLRVGDICIAGKEWGHVRAMFNEHGKKMTEAGPATPVEILGLQGTPAAGDDFVIVKDENQAKEVTGYRIRKERDAKLVKSAKSAMEQMLDKIKSGEVKHLPVIIKADVQGSIEAIEGTIKKLSNEEVSVQILHSAVGPISDSDVTLAKASNAFIIGFNVRAIPHARDMARQDGVDIRYYSIIYDVADDIKKALEGMLSPELREKIIGYAEIRNVFNITGVGKVGGCMVTEGFVKRGAKVRLLRDNVVIHDGALAQLKRFKEDVKEVKSGYECGMSFENYNDIQVGDFIECYEVEEIAATL